MAGSLSDISSLKEVEEELTRAARLDSLRELVIHPWASQGPEGPLFRLAALRAALERRAGRRQAYLTQRALSWQSFMSGL